MKTLLMKFAVCAGCVLLLASCETTKSAAGPQSPDAYEPVELPSGSGTELKVPDRQAVPLIKGADPVELGNSSVFEYDMLGFDVVQENATYFYYPDTGEVCMRLTGLAVKTYVLFNSASRSVCRQAVAQYEKEFNDHILDRDSDTYKAYGDFTGHYKWGALGPANETKPKVSVGYKFVKDSPYFTLTMWPADGVYKTLAQQDDVASSEKNTILMTKKQATDMISFMDEQKIIDIVDKLNVPTAKGDQY